MGSRPETTSLRPLMTASSLLIYKYRMYLLHNASLLGRFPVVRMFIRHPVEDFESWKQIYDDFDDKRQEMGVIGDAVFQAVKNPKDVTVWHDFEDLDSARSFARSDRLQEAMEEAGVTGEPTVWFTEPA